MRPTRALLADWPLKLTSLLVSLLLWFAAAGEEPATAVVRVAVTVRPPPGRTVLRGPESIQALVVGPRRELVGLSAARLQLLRVLPDTLTGDQVRLDLAPAEIALPAGLGVHVQDLQPRTVTVELDSTFQRIVPVHPVVRPAAEPGSRLLGTISIVPGLVRLLGPRTRLRRLDSMLTVPLEVAHAEGLREYAVAVDTSGLGPVRVQPRLVRVTVEVAGVAERVLHGVPVRLPSALAESLRPDRDEVSVRLRGAVNRLAALSADSLVVLVEEAGAGSRRAALRVLAPQGVRGRAEPDSVGLLPRGERG